MRLRQGLLFFGTQLCFHMAEVNNYFTFVLTETIALANGGGSAASEVLRLASQIVPGDFDGWFSEYDWMGDQMYALAQRAKASISKRGTLFRAASYWRLSGFFLTGNASDSRLYGKWDLGLEAFSEAISLLPQDVWHQLGQEATSRGYNFVTYEGPNQPTVRRHDNIRFIPNWWDVVTSIVDEISSRADVDMDNLAYIGVPFGGELALRVASREHRFKALPEELVEAFGSQNATLFDEAMTYALSVPPRTTEFTWVTGQGLWSFNTTSYYDWLTQLGTFKVTQELVNNIRTPYLFVGEGEDDSLALGQPLALVSLYENAIHPLNTTYYRFPTNLGAGEHCQLGAEPQLAQEVYDWLYGIF
ncbi:hypothetical protein SCUP234_11333 [Seiridium cupressi]